MFSKLFPVEEEQMNFTSRVRRWWTEEEDKILGQEVEFQCKYAAWQFTSRSLVRIARSLQ